MATLMTLNPVVSRVAQRWMFEDAEVPAFGRGEDLLRSIESDYVLRIGDRPIARSIRALYGLRKKRLPAEIDVLKGETYLISHAVGVAAARGAGRVRTLGYSASFAGEGSTVELFPNTSFRETLASQLTFSAIISADGSARVPEQLTRMAQQVLPIGLGAELALSAEGTTVGRLGLSVKTPRVQAVGQASSRCVWQFDKDQQPLVGDQAMLQTVVLPRGEDTIAFTIQAFAVIDPGVFKRPIRI